MNKMKEVTNWERYEDGEDEAKDILNRYDDKLFGVGRAIEMYKDDPKFEKIGQLSYKFGYLDVIISALEDESERVKLDILNYYVKGEENERESEGNTSSDERSVDPGSEAGDI